jgi:hypothetical protein
LKQLNLAFWPSSKYSELSLLVLSIPNLAFLP